MQSNNFKVSLIIVFVPFPISEEALSTINWKIEKEKWAENASITKYLLQPTSTIVTSLYDIARWRFFP